MRAFALVLLTALVTGPARAEPISAERASFETNCARCHGARGRSDTESARALKVKPLAGDRALAQMEPAAIVRLVKSNPKHPHVGASVDLDDASLSAAASYVRAIAAEP